MNWPATVQAIAAAVTALVSIVGFVMVITQLILLKRATKSDTNGRLSEQSLEIIAYIADHPYLYDYLYASKPLSEADNHKVEVLCLCEMVANYCGFVVATLKDIDYKSRDRWLRFITDTLVDWH